MATQEINPYVLMNFLARNQNMAQNAQLELLLEFLKNYQRQQAMADLQNERRYYDIYDRELATRNRVLDYLGGVGQHMVDDAITRSAEQALSNKRDVVRRLGATTETIPIDRMASRELNDELRRIRSQLAGMMAGADERLTQRISDFQERRSDIPPNLGEALGMAQQLGAYAFPGGISLPFVARGGGIPSSTPNRIGMVLQPGQAVSGAAPWRLPMPTPEMRWASFLANRTPENRFVPISSVMSGAVPTRPPQSASGANLMPRGVGSQVPGIGVRPSPGPAPMAQPMASPLPMNVVPRMSSRRSVAMPYLPIPAPTRNVPLSEQFQRPTPQQQHIQALRNTLAQLAIAEKKGFPGQEQVDAIAQRLVQMGGGVLSPGGFHYTEGGAAPPNVNMVPVPPGEPPPIDVQVVRPLPPLPSMSPGGYAGQPIRPTPYKRQRKSQAGVVTALRNLMPWIPTVPSPLPAPNLGMFALDALANYATRRRQMNQANRR